MIKRSPLLLILIAVALSSCVKTYSLTPINAPYRALDWAAEPDDAVVFIGIAGGTSVHSVVVSGQRFDTHAEYQRMDPVASVAVPMKVGEEFELTVAALESRYTGDAVIQRYFSLEDLPTITIERPGAYVFGTLVIDGQRAAFTQDNQDALIAAALRDHPVVLDQMTPVNF